MSILKTNVISEQQIWCIIFILILYASPDDLVLCKNGRRTVENYFGISSTTIARVWMSYQDQVMNGIFYPDLSTNKVVECRNLLQK